MGGRLLAGCWGDCDGLSAMFLRAEAGWGLNFFVILVNFTCI